MDMPELSWVVFNPWAGSNTMVEDAGTGTEESDGPTCHSNHLHDDKPGGTPPGGVISASWHKTVGLVRFRSRRSLPPSSYYCICMYMLYHVIYIYIIIYIYICVCVLYVCVYITMPL